MAAIKESQSDTLTISDDEETDVMNTAITDICNISSDDDDDGDVEIINSPICVKVEIESDEDCQITQVIENTASLPNERKPQIPEEFFNVDLKDDHSATSSTNNRIESSIKLELAETIDKKVTIDLKAEGSDSAVQRGIKSELENPDYAYDDDNATYVSADIYAREKSNFDTLVKNVLSAEEKLKALENQPDTAKVDKDALEEAKNRVDALNKRLNLMSQYIDDLRIEGEPKSVDNSSISWDRVYAGVNKHHIDATGSAAEFYQHKSNIISGLKTLYETVGPPPSETEFADQPKGLVVELLKHQKKGLAWMQWRETQKIRGGILADDMGLGKTLSMIALVLARKEQNQIKNPVVKKNDYEYQQKQLELFMAQSTRKPITLFEEVNGKEKKPKIEVKLTPVKREASEQLPTGDGSEDEIEDFLLPRRMCKREAPKLLSYEDYMDDDVDDFLLPAKSKNAGTLVVCPTSVLAQWADEIKSKLASNALTAYIFHGPDRRSIGLSKFRRMNVVITSYGIVSSEYTNHGNDSWLFSSNWERLILDEAHFIRNTKTTSWTSISELKGKCCWALTGTPIQNCALDCFALLKFLKVPNFKDLHKWRRYLNEGMAGHRRMNFLIKPLMLRRTKLALQESGELPPLPPLEIKYIDVHLSSAEMEVYQIISAISLRIFAQFLRQREKNNIDLDYYANDLTPHFMAGSIEEKYEEIYNNFLGSLKYNPKERVQGIVILVLLLRLRQFCCHPGLMVKMLCGDSNEEDESDEENNVKREDDEVLKLDIPDAGDGETVKSDKLTASVEATMRLLKPSNPIFEFSRPSAKLQLIFVTLKQLLQDTDDKIIVVSEWTSYLRLIKDHLEQLGFETLDFNGTMDARARSETLSELNNVNNNKRILLLSLKAGGVGLNLNVANHLLLVDLHWNPQLERQAQDRIYRYGQLKPSFIYRFMCKDTIEQRIKALQDYKLEISNVVLDRDASAPAGAARPGNALTLNDYKKLFGMK